MSEAEDQLRQELVDLKQRFSDWKTRAKTAVDKEREKFVEISERNDALTQQNTELNAAVEACRGTEGDLRAQIASLEAALAELRDAHAQATAVPVPAVEDNAASDAAAETIANLTEQLDASRATILGLESALSDAKADVAVLHQQFSAMSDGLFAAMAQLATNGTAVLAAKQQVFTASIEGVFGTTITSLNGAVADAANNLERHKRNMERTMKLATRDQDGAKAELDGLRNTVKALEEDNAHKGNSVKQRDLAIAALEQRLEEAASALGQYETDTVSSTNNAHYVAELQQRVADMEREFGDREMILHDQHRDEVDRLLQKHDEDMAHARMGYEDQLRDLSFEMNAGGAGGMGGGGMGGGYALANDDAAYEELLGENTRLQREIDDGARVRSDLQRELAAAKEKLSRFDVPAVSAGSGLASPSGALGRVHVDTSAMDPQVMRRKIYDLEKQMAALGEQMLHANQELIEHKAAARERQNQQQHASSSSGLDGSGSSGAMGSPAHQQHVYMKAILVKMLCAKTDDVKSSLLPVVSTLVKFSNEELKAIYSANPNWIH